MTSLVAVTAGVALAGAATCFPPEAALDAFRADWFCRQLNAAAEQRLSGDPAYRFSYLPSFHPARIVVIRLESGRRVVVGKVLSGRGGYDAGTVARTTRRDLTANEWRLLEQRLESAGMWESPDPRPEPGLDGAEWVLEGTKAGQYRLHAVWSPKDDTFPQFRKVCVYMLELAGIMPDNHDVY